MATYWITFRISSETAGGRTYQDRYAALIEAIKPHAVKWWFEPTSFWIIRSASDRASVARSVKAVIALDKDLVLIGSMETQGAVLIGTASEKDLLDLVPNLTRA